MDHSRLGNASYNNSIHKNKIRSVVQEVFLMSNTPHPAATIATALAHWDRHGVLSPEDIATIASRVYRLAGCQDIEILTKSLNKLTLTYPVLWFTMDESSLYIEENRADLQVTIASISRKADR